MAFARCAIFLSFDTDTLRRAKSLVNALYPSLIYAESNDFATSVTLEMAGCARSIRTLSHATRTTQAAVDGCLEVIFELDEAWYAIQDSGILARVRMELESGSCKNKQVHRSILG